MTGPSYLRAQGDLVYLHVKVQPRASRHEIAGALGNELKVKIAAPPVGSAANEALIKFLADLLECPRSAIQLVRGQASRHKTLSIRAISHQTIVQKLDPGNHD